MENAHALSPEQVLQHFNVDPHKGLTKQQVEDNRRKYGPNEIIQEDGTPFWKLILKQFEDLLVRILLAAAVISFLLALFEDEGSKATAFIEPLVIMLILIANATVGVWQDRNAEKAIEALKAYEAPTAVVLRDGILDQIAAVDLVPGDIIDVAASPGKDMIPADARLLQLYSTTLRLDQAPLTGESDAVMKFPESVAMDADTIDKRNILFSGTTVSYGRARAVVVLTGKKTKIGQIRVHVSEEDDADTPLKKKLDEFGEQLSKVIFVICALVWIVNIGHFTDPEHGNFIRGAIYYFKIAVALAVAAIPEGLPAVVTTCLALGTRKMAEKNAIVRELPSVETLGCTTVICSDKTGTLTTNMMSVAKVMTVTSAKGNRVELLEYDVDDTRFEPNGNLKCQGRVIERPANEPTLEAVAKICALCNDSSLRFNEETNKVEKSGEATEAALRVLVEKIGIPESSADAEIKRKPVKMRFDACNKYWESKHKKVQILEFSRDRKSMSTYCEGDVLFVKGAPENILSRCTRVMLGDGTIVDINDSIKESVQEKVLQFGTGVSTLRCLGLAYLERASTYHTPDFSDPTTFGQFEQNMTFVGIVGMLDPPRPEVKDAIRTCNEAGIRVIVITGDNKATAESICKRIGVFDANEDLTGKSFTGKEFDMLSETQKHDAVRQASLFCRVEPSHKMRLVELLQAQGEIVAMTGDGVNDAPALKKANIGVAMGSGTAAARESSKMVLKDDNFATIVSAVQEGRAIFDNTKQFIRYLISSNIGEVVCIFLTAALGMPEALVPVQLLWVNLVTDGLPATALGFNPPEPDIMKREPRSSTEPIVNGWLFIRYLIIGVYVGLATVGGFAHWYLYYSEGPLLSWYDLTHFHKCVEGSQSYSCSIFRDMRPSTVSLSILVTIEMFNALNAISENDSILRLAPWTNPWLIGAISLSFTLHFIILYVPFFATLFGVTPISWGEWKIVLAWSAPIIVIDEILKFLSRTVLSKRQIAAQKKHR